MQPSRAFQRPPSARGDGAGPRNDVADLLGRIGTQLGSQRVELFSIRDHRLAVLNAWWTAFGSASPGPAAPTGSMPLDWFPWSLGNIKPSEYVFVRNAGALPVHSDSGLRVSDLGFGSALYLPVACHGAAGGAVATYWEFERRSWPSRERLKVCEWAASALSEFDRPGASD